MNTLYGKLALALGGLLLIIGLAYVLISQSLTQRYMQEADQRFNRDLARNLVIDRNIVAQGKLDKEALKQTFELYMTINPSIEIYLLDLQGNILAYSADPGVVKRNSVALQPVQAFLAGAPLPLFGDDPRSHDRRKSFSVTPVPSSEAPEGYLYVVLQGERHDAVERLFRDSLVLRLSVWILAGSLLLGLLAGLLLFYLLTRRLRRLNRLMTGFRDSKFQKHVPYDSSESASVLSRQNAINGDEISVLSRQNAINGDEVDQLGTGFDQMAIRMQGMLEELKEADVMRRELVNNVSHDLRTPLTSLHGYLETLRYKSREMTPAQRGQYLEAALGHSARLGKLIAELFALAKLDARAVEPKPEVFSPAELLHDIAQKFQLPAQEKNIRLDFVMPSDGSGHVFVNADIGLIERVMENLIANALVYTPKEGQIRLLLTLREDRVTIGVSDTGRGIAREDLPRVFKRYFKGDRGSHGAGLGLAIAKRIVELHASELSVSSKLNQGACFSFALPVWRA